MPLDKKGAVSFLSLPAMSIFLNCGMEKGGDVGVEFKHYLKNHLNFEDNPAKYSVLYPSVSAGLLKTAREHLFMLAESEKKSSGLQLKKNTSLCEKKTVQSDCRIENYA